MLKPLPDLDEVQEYVNEGIVEFYQQRMKLLQGLTFQELLGKKICLFRPMHAALAGDILEDLLEAFLCSSGEHLFEGFLKDLSLFVARKAYGGHKSTMPGIDLEFENMGVYYIVLVKSGLNTGNSPQYKELAQELRNATVGVKRSRGATAKVEPILGICYGRDQTNHVKAGYLKVVGHDFWYLISGSRDLYADIIEPVGRTAKEYDDAFHEQKDRVVNRFTRQFLEEFCSSTGAIDWVRMVEFNSGNCGSGEFLS